MAPQGPDSAPGPSMATFVPPPWVLAFMMFLLMTIRLYTWYIHDWEHVCYGFRHVSPSRPIHTRRRTLSFGSRLVSLPRTINTRIDFVMILNRTHTPLRSLGNLRLPDASLPGRPQITLIVIWDFFTQDVTSLA